MRITSELLPPHPDTLMINTMRSFVGLFFIASEGKNIK